MDEITGSAIASAMSSASSAAPAPASGPDSPPAAAGASPAPGPATTPQAARVDPAVAQTAAPGTPTTDVTADQKSTEPPPEKWPQILDNARTKARGEVRAQYQWAEAVAPEHRETVGQFYQLLDQSPVGAIDLLFRQAATDPQYQGQLRSWLGRVLGTRSAPASAPAERGSLALPQPDTFGVDDQGHQIPLYSAAVMPKLMAALEAQIKAAYATELGPLKADLQTRQQRDAEAQQHRDATAWADREYAKVAKYPHFTTYEKEIGAAMQADPTLDVYDAYVSIVMPKLDTQARQSFAASTQDKVNAASINPAQPTTATTTRPKDFLTALKQVPASAWGGR